MEMQDIFVKGLSPDSLRFLLFCCGFNFFPLSSIILIIFCFIILIFLPVCKIIEACGRLQNARSYSDQY